MTATKKVFSTNEEKQDIGSQAKALAAKFIKKEGESIRGGESYILEAVFTLLDPSGGKLEVISYQAMIRKLLQIISIPAVQEQLDKWEKENAGKVLLELHDFFTAIDGESVENCLVWMELEKFCGCMTEKELESSKQYLRSKQVL